mmetsp:Transcript_43021/g.79799  ORF Transcript_43021/g.79799 Transcript_43021/m.79799 type:complete len:250 (-) Transcript_43021:2606-3355(-)
MRVSGETPLGSDDSDIPTVDVLGEICGDQVTSSSLFSAELDPGRMYQKPTGELDRFEESSLLPESSDPSEFERPSRVGIIDGSLSRLTSAITLVAHSSHSSCSTVASPVSELLSEPDDCAIGGGASLGDLFSESSLMKEDKFVLEADLKRSTAGDDVEREDFFPEFTRGLGEGRLLGNSCSTRALVAAAWCQRPFSMAAFVSSVAMDMRTSSLDGTSPASSFLQHMTAISYRVSPAFTPALRRVDEARK